MPNSKQMPHATPQLSPLSNNSGALLDILHTSIIWKSTMKATFFLRVENINMWINKKKWKYSIVGGLKSQKEVSVHYTMIFSMADITIIYQGTHSTKEPSRSSLCIC